MRATVVKVPYHTPGLLFAKGRQIRFVLEGVWPTAVAPASNIPTFTDMTDSLARLACVPAPVSIDNS